MDMVERVARALALSDMASKRKHGIMSETAMPWRGFADDARAAIEAMRAATGEMVEAGAEEGSPYTITSPEWDHEVTRTCDVWDAMIDAALTPPVRSQEDG